MSFLNGLHPNSKFLAITDYARTAATGPERLAGKLHVT